ncbi:MAG: S9 family peptidase [Prevotella sp.]
MKKVIISAAIMAAQSAFAGDIAVKEFRYAGPYVMQRPVMVDSIDINRKAFDVESILDTPIDIKAAAGATVFKGAMAPKADNADMALHLLHFRLTANGYAKAKLNVGKMKRYRIFIDGEKSDGNLTLLPATHDVVIKYLTEKGGKGDSLDVSVTCDNEQLLSVDTETTRSYSLIDVLNGPHFRSTDLSADGRYLITAVYDVTGANDNVWKWHITDVKTKRKIGETDMNISWMPGSASEYWFTRKASTGRQLVKVDVLTGKETVLAKNIPEGHVTLAPTGDYLIISRTVEGPKDDKDVHQYVHPDDRQPGWRNRTALDRYDLKTGVTQPLTFGYHPLGLLDISRDGRYILYSVARPRLTKRPTSLFSIYRLDLTTMQNETIIDSDGFVGNAMFSPDAKDILVNGSPEAFDGIGRNLPADRTPSMVDNQLYLVNCSSRKVTPLTVNFAPCVEGAVWNAYDNKVYLTALDRDRCNLFVIDIAKDGKISRIDVPEENVAQFALAEKAPVMTFYGQGASNTDRLYALDIRNGKSTLMRDLHAERFKDVEIATCQAWDFVNTKGDTVCGRFYLPPHFDKTKKYPLIVNYYGGCSPTTRSFESRYPHNLYAAMGYVVYVVQPSGATGFGQEFASRHVNTAGEGPAQDIIEGTKRFCEEHDFVDAKKIGCIGASYGGFMSQYLQTKTDIFAAAISHAGISDHTSYWGEGFWGYSYSEVSMANSYPWTRRDLYIDRSPLFNVEKIHTPILFLHGTDDNNVPIGESIQMYNALRLLDRPTAFVVVEGQDHHILDYEKRIKWQNTIFAWFAKWLKDDDSWWKAMYDKMDE